MQNIVTTEAFIDDKLDRLSLAQNFKTILLNTDANVFSISASWGGGKTYFVENLIKLLGEDSINILYNAWETDFYDSPLIPLLVEMLSKIEQNKDELEQEISKCKTIASNIVGKTSFQFGVGTEFVNFSAIFDPSKKLIDSKYIELKNKILEFKKELSNIQHKRGKKVIIFVDELDRCHPIYAIKTLEIIKHFFGIPNVIFVLAIDKKQIENSVRTVFGINIDETDGYLRKFIDVEFVLPVPNLKKLIDFHMDNTMGKIEKFIKDKKYYMYRSTSSIPTEKEKISNLIEKTLCFLMFKPRDVEKYFIRLSLTLDILSKNDILFIEPFVVLNALCLFKGGSEFRNYCGGEETGITKYINTKILKHWENFFNNDEFVKTVRRARQMDSYSQYTKEDNAYEIFYNFFSTGGEAEATKYLNQYPSNIEFINNFNI